MSVVTRAKGARILEASSMHNTPIVLGIDIGGTNTKFGFVDRAGRCLADAAIPTCADQPPGQMFQRLHAGAMELLAGLEGSPRLAGIGIGAPNANYYKGTIEQPPNLSWRWVDLKAELAPYFSVPMAATNDANAAALGEMLFGGARGMRDFIVITLGTGLGPWPSKPSRAPATCWGASWPTRWRSPARRRSSCSAG
jgi:glucokinase